MTLLKFDFNRVTTIWLDRVQDVTWKYGILGKVFGFGDIEVESAGTYGRIVFGGLPSLQRLQEEVQKAILNFHLTSRSADSL